MFPKSVVAAVDFSPATDAVCDKALAVVEPSEGKVHFVHAFSLSELSESTLRAGGVVHDAHTVAEAELRKLVEPRLASGRVGQIIVQEGDPATALIKTAEQLKADLIVVDSYHRGLDRFAHGSVAESLVRNAACSVLVVRP